MPTATASPCTSRRAAGVALLGLDRVAEGVAEVEQRALAVLEADRVRRRRPCSGSNAARSPRPARPRRAPAARRHGPPASPGTRASTIAPYFTTSASPARSSRSGRVASVAVSATTARGGWNAPTRFLPAGRSTAVLPPTEESTIASSVVGTCTQSMPRIQRGRGEAGEVADHAAAQRDHRGIARGAQRGQRVDRFAPAVERLLRFAGGRTCQPTRSSGRCRRSDASITGPCSAITFASVHDQRVAPAHCRGQRGAVGDQALPDADRIRPARAIPRPAARHRPASHRPAAARATARPPPRRACGRRCRCAGPRPPRTAARANAPSPRARRARSGAASSGRSRCPSSRSRWIAVPTWRCATQARSRRRSRLARVEHRAGAGGQHRRVLAQGLVQQARLQRAEGRLAVLGEDRGDALAGRLLDARIEIDEAQPAACGQRRADGGLAGAGGADEDDARGKGHPPIVGGRPRPAAVGVDTGARRAAASSAPHNGAMETPALLAEALATFDRLFDAARAPANPTPPPWRSPPPRSTRARRCAWCC